MMPVRVKVQSASGIIHLVADHIIDHSELLNCVAGSDEAFALPAEWSDDAQHDLEPDARDVQTLRKAGNIFIPDIHIDTLNVKAQISGEMGRHHYCLWPCG